MGSGRRAGEAPALGGPRDERRIGRGRGWSGGKGVEWKEKERSEVGVESSMTAVLLLLFVLAATAAEVV